MIEGVGPLVPCFSIFQTAMTEVSEFDSYDSRILGELQTDARITMAELGRRVHLSQPAVTERVRKLELQGVIKGYRGWAMASGRWCAWGAPSTRVWSSSSSRRLKW